MVSTTQQQIETFWRNGAVVIPDVVTADQLHRMRVDFAGWVEDSRSETAAYGQMMDGRPRFDVDGGHSAQTPSLRRVASPTELSEAYREVAFESGLADVAAELIGPNVRFHHSKINSKLPHTTTTVKWHQDFTFDPHSNDDLITALLFLDDVTPQNGPLHIVPGTHRGPLRSLWHSGKFTGAVSEDLVPGYERAAIPCHGPAGSVCLMHSRVAHASEANRSDGPRTLFIVAYAAADAIPLAANAVPSIHEGAMVRGTEPRRIRSMDFEMEMPEVPKGASFFVQQEGGS